MVDARRIKALSDQFGARFYNRIFTSEERAYAESVANPNLSLAKRFAAKEAVSKAMGSGIRGFLLRDIEIIHDDLGCPAVRLHNGAARRLSTITPKDKWAHIHLSLSDEAPYALAMVVIETRAVIEACPGSSIEP